MTEQPEQPGTEKRCVSASRVIPAPPQVIFDLLADPARHAEIDGSASVQGARGDSVERLHLGAQFGMDMKMFGIPYRITNEVVEFDEPNRIAWRHLGRHVWRYELTPADSTGDQTPATLVTESFDWSDALVPVYYELFGWPRKHVANMTRTLQRLEQVVAGS